MLFWKKDAQVKGLTCWPEMNDSHRDDQCGLSTLESSFSADPQKTLQVRRHESLIPWSVEENRYRQPDSHGRVRALPSFFLFADLAGMLG